MKKRLYMLVAALFATTMMVLAQQYDEKYGADPADRENNIKILNMFQDAYNMKQYEEALVMMRDLVVKCPKATPNMYIRGVEIYRNKMLKATSKEDRTKYLDSMMILYDQRAEAFGDSPKQGLAYIKEQKAKMFYDFAPNEVEKATKYFREAIDVAKDKVDPDAVVAYFNMLTESFKLDDMGPEQYINVYEYVTDLLAKHTAGNAKDALESVEKLFVSSGAANCEVIEKIFRPKYEANPNDADLVKKMLGLFERGKCSSDFQLSLLEKYYQLDPKPEYAMMLASIYEGKRNFSKALEYIQVGIDGEKDPAQKVNHYLRAASAQLSLSRYRDAANLAQKVMAIDDTKGLAHLIYAGAVAGGVGQSCSDFDRQTAYWLVVDYYRNALKYFEGDADQMENINKAIYSYTANFPKKDDIFMYGLDEGASYTVNCGWISGRTIVRGR